MVNSVPVFILGSGRCGTFQIFKLLDGVNGLEVIIMIPHSTSD